MLFVLLCICLFGQATGTLPGLKAVEDEGARLSKLHQYSAAVALRETLMNNSDVSSAFLAAQSQDLLQLGRHDEAIDILEMAGKRALQQRNPAVGSLLLRAQAKAMICRGPAGALAALKTLNRARSLDKKQSGESKGQPDDAWLEMDLMRRVLSQQGKPGGPPAPIAGMLTAQSQKIVEALLHRGPWVEALQLPRHMTPGLRSLPWHSVEDGVQGSYPALRPWVEAVKRHTGALRAEAIRLLSTGLMEEERECIHAPEPVATRKSDWPARASAQAQVGPDGQAVASETDSSGKTLSPEQLKSLVPSGSWKAYLADGYFHAAEKKDAAGCNAVDAPAACALAQELRSLLPSGPKILRVSYSALGPGAYLHPHWGQSNAQLKFHVGLIVPCGRGSAEKGGAQGTVATATCSDPCARFTVGNITRAWAEGDVLFFDDSYLHTVTNECDLPRVVLQVLFEHPDLQQLKGKGKAKGKK